MKVELLALFVGSAWSFGYMESAADTIAVHTFGKAPGYPNPDGFTGFCFDLSMTYDGEAGTATDCLVSTENLDCGIYATGYAYFYFADGNVMTANWTATVAPIVAPLFVNAINATHLTGGTGYVTDLQGTGSFGQGFVGGAHRISGVGDLSEFTGAEGDLVGFDDLWVVTAAQ